MPAKRLKRQHFPSITGRAAAGPMSPSPRTALPSVTTPTQSPLEVTSYSASGFRSISRQGSATPGV